MTFCDLHNVLRALIMTFWSPDSDCLWSLHWCCKPFAMMFCATITMTSRVPTMIICDIMTFCDLHNDLCAPTMIVCDLHSNFWVLSMYLCPSWVWVKQWVCVLLQGFSVYSKWRCVPYSYYVCLHNDCVPSYLLCDFHNYSEHFKLTCVPSQYLCMSSQWLIVPSLGVGINVTMNVSSP